MRNASYFFSCLLLPLIALNLNAKNKVFDGRMVAVAQTASIEGNNALWHNPAGLAFLGGSESGLLYLYEWSDLGNRHHACVNGVVNFLETVSLGLGVRTQLALNRRAKENLGSEVMGIFGLALNPSPHTAFGFSVSRAYQFLRRKAGPWLFSFGFQARPLNFLSFGGHYEEVHRGVFSAPNLTAGISFRPLQELVTIGIDAKWVSLTADWDKGFRFHPIFSIKTSYKGYGAGLSVEIPGIRSGWNKPVFAISFDINFAHLGLGFSTLIDSKQNNFALGSNLRLSSDEWTSVAPLSGQWVELTIDSDGTLETHKKTLTAQLFSADESPLSVLALLRRIERDKNVSGLVLNFKGFSFGDARAQEWRDAVLALRRSNKRVVVYLDAPSERDYYIASVADSILMNRQATLSLSRFKTTLVYFGDMLKKIGVSAEAVVAGRYKTAPRMWTHAHPQPQEIEVANNILNSFYETLLKEVADSRKIDLEKLKVLFQKNEITATKAKEAGLVDELIDAKEAVQHIVLPNNKSISLKSDYENQKIKREGWHKDKRIAVIPITHTIVDGRVSPGIFSNLFPLTGAQDIIDAIESAMNDPDVLGIIVRIDSPGGDAIAGHKIQHALVTAQKMKPVVASLSDVAASAGYLIASGSNRILALPNTITGSIGVFSLMFCAETLAKSLSIFSKELSPLKTPGPSIFREFSPEERREAQGIVDWYYENFIQTVSKGLELDKTLVEKNADGRVWLGKEAFDRNLINEIGGFSKAIDSIRTLLKLAKDQTVTLDIKNPNLMQFPLMAGLRSNSQAASNVELAPFLNFAQPYLRALEAYRLGSPQARLPFYIERRSRY